MEESDEDESGSVMNSDSSEAHSEADHVEEIDLTKNLTKNNDILATLLNQLNESHKTILGMGGRKKKPKDDDDTYDFGKQLGRIKVDRRPVTLRFCDVKDDGWTVLAEEFRGKIRPVNACPTDHYKMYSRHAKLQF